jgi:GDP-mannose 4,6-dehydratase
VELLPTYFTLDNFTANFGDIKCKVVSSISMFYDLPDPVQFAKDIYSVLEPNGIWTCEQSYLLTMLRTNSIDTICHEHLEYYSMHNIKDISDRAGFKIIDVKFNDCNGGSSRVYFAKKESSVYDECTDLINSILKDEDVYGISNVDTYATFMRNCDTQVARLTQFIDAVNANGQKVHIYGASTKGNCLLQYANIDESRIKYAVERNPNKIGKMTCTGIEIISEETMRANPPNFLLVLPWHFRKEILERETTFLTNGGQFLFPFPEFEIVGAKPKLLITGCDGMIATFVKKQFTDYNSYGVSKSGTYESNITKFHFDLTNAKQVEELLLTIKPDVVVHLASISSSHYAFNNPIETLNSNGMVTAHLCDTIHRNGLKCKLFNASSSEIYKGHIEYEVSEDDTNKYHLHPYSIAKIMGHSIVDFYRTTYSLPFSNGTIFTTESSLKRPEFLLNKMANHIKSWNSGDFTPLHVGNLESYRNILHASDVSNAIHYIVSQDRGDSYLISNDLSHKVVDLVTKLYSAGCIELDRKGDILYSEDKPVIIIGNGTLGFDSQPTNITGESIKLKKLGWKPLVSIDNILRELIE